MTLLIDAGNTRIKFGWYPQDQVVAQPITVALLPEELGQLKQKLLAAQAPLGHWHQACSPAIGVNVAGLAIQDTIQRAIEQLGLGPIRWVRSEPSACGVHNGYRQASQLGADRWAALLGLHAHTRDQADLDMQPLLLASFGTATTIDTLSPKDAQGWRHFPGGLILPGPSLMLHSLKQNTAQLPLGAGLVSDYPQDTLAAIASGVAASQAGAVLRQWQICLHKYGHPPAIFLSGGGTHLIQEELHSLLKYAERHEGIAAPICSVLETPVLLGLAQLIIL